MKDIQIAVAVHKDYWMPADALYRAVQAGSAGKPPLREDWQRDDGGDNISDKNSYYCELTVLYWAWKNLKAGYLGLAHYRRYFASRLFGEKRERIAGRAALERKLAKADAILPKKRHYWIETNYSQYVHAHKEIGLVQTKEILGEMYPDYLPAWERVMKRRSGHRFNMFVFRRDLLEAYCQWLFTLLFELENRLQAAGQFADNARVIGFVSERLLDIWLEKNKVRYVEMSVVHLENQHWPKKLCNFLCRKLRAERCAS